MILNKSLSTRIVIMVVLLVAVGFIAEFAISKYSATKVANETETLIKLVEKAFFEKDNFINQVLEKKLEEGVSHLENKQAYASLQEEKKFLVEQSHLSGVQDGMSKVILTLINSAMMSGEAEKADAIIDSVLENPQIAAVNLWRTDGKKAFRDNTTITEVNKFLDDPEAFTLRDTEETEPIPNERAKVLIDVVSNNKKQVGKNVPTTEGWVKNEEGERLPVIYSYFVLQNDEDCQSCHHNVDEPRGVLEVGVSSLKLLELRKDITLRKEAISITQKEQAVALKEENDKSQIEKKQFSDKVSKDINDAQIGLRVTQDEASTSFITASIIFFAILATAMVFMLRHNLTKPLHSVTDAISRLVRGELDVKVPLHERQDEIGEIAKAVQVFKVTKTEQLQNELKQKEISEKAEQEKSALIKKMAENFEQSVGHVVLSVSEAAQNMQSSAETMNAISKDTADKSSSVAASSEQASQSVEMVAAATEEMTASIQEITRQVHDSSAIASSAVSEAQNTTLQVKGLADAAKSIGEVVELISSITEQTNLLALNATVEAARAGEAGKGFAVVAGEVKNLANQTARATQAIIEQVEGIQDATNETVHAIEGISSTIQKMDEITSSISTSMEEQDAATHEIASNIDQASEATRMVSANINGVSSSAQDAGKSANDVLVTSETLNDNSNKLKSEVEGFLNQFRKGS